MKRLWVIIGAVGVWAGCGDEGPASQPGAADAVADTAIGADVGADGTLDASDATGPDIADVESVTRSVLGTWKAVFRSSWYEASYTYTFSGAEDGGRVAIRLDQTDWNLELAGCTRVDVATGSWTLTNGQLDVVPEEGTTARGVTFGEPDCGIGADMSYAERALDEAELRALDLADGPIGWVDAFEGPRLLTEREGYQYEWMQR